MKVKINKQNIISKKAQMSYLQMLILIVSTFAFAYLIYNVTEVSAQEKESLEEKAERIILGDYSQTEEITTQSLEQQTMNFACCEKTKDGNYCQFVQEEKCDEGFRKAPSECKNVDYCKTGCCYSSKTGWCNENTPKRSCEESKGKWTEDSYCNIAECQRGCCVLGKNALWTTKRNCEVEAGFLGIGTDFRQDINSEIECIFLAEKDDEGACVIEEAGIEEKTCKFTTRESCKNSGGNFYKNTYCSDSALDTNCQTRERKGCSEDSRDQSVYWYDSCGNREEIAEECSIFVGTICGLVNEEYKCKSIDCKTKDGKTRKNGESWCEYDGTIGEGKDVVGSRHWKHICFMGEERIEVCQDYRNQICVQSDTNLGNGKTFSEAACRINNWRSCLDYNIEGDKEKMAEKCEENPDCFIKHISAADKFAFNFCVPEYPPGFDLTSEASGRNAELVCGMASQRCTVVYVKKISGWDCEVNCACEKAGFAQAMNDFCTSLGDCGAYVNIAGEVTDEGYSVSRSPKLSSNYLNSLKKYALYKPGQKAEPGNLSFLGGLGGPGGASYETGGKNYLMQGLGMWGVAFAAKVSSYLFLEHATIEQAFLFAQTEGATVVGPLAPLAPFLNALASVGAALAASSLLIIAFGLKGDAANIMTYVGIAVAISAIMGWGPAIAFVTGVSQIIVGILTLDTALIGGGLSNIWNPVGWLLLAAAIILSLLGIGDTKKKVVTFSCLPWQPPAGGTNCAKCNGDLFKPCSDYRCKSLGQTCQLINKGTEQELCVNVASDDVSSPRISPFYGVITKGYEYYNIKDNGFEVTSKDKSCIPEFTNVIFGISTNKPSQCKIGTEPLQAYDEMEQYFGGSNLYLTNHTSLLNIPSPEAFRNQYNLTSEQVKKIGEINYYVKCKSVNGATNEASFVIKSCVKPGPDLTPPYVAKTSPISGSYVAYNATEQILNLWTNEPTSCKWSVENKDFEQMENEMSCEKDLEDYGLWGWPCNTTLTNLDSNKDNVFYIRCQDISDNKNTMTESYVYELKKSESELQIVEINPANGKKVVAATEPTTLNLEVKTSGGAEQGKADCSYKFRENDEYIRFYDTFSNLHKQVFSSIIGGSYTVYIKCEDIAGNEAVNLTEFTVYVDRDAPKVTRVYYDAGLKVMTNEDATCAYSFVDAKCKFELDNLNNNATADLMTGEGKEHSVEWQTESTYYIKCQDTYGNMPGKCSIVVRPYDLNGK